VRSRSRPPFLVPSFGEGGPAVTASRNNKIRWCSSGLWLPEEAGVNSNRSTCPPQGRTLIQGQPSTPIDTYASRAALPLPM
jgi:hypothetical protein